jgi:signal transduction histidine kinase
MQALKTLWTTTLDLSGQSGPERHFLDAVRQAVLWAVLLVAVASLVAAVLSRQLIAPLRQLTAAAEAMAEGDLSQRVQVRSRDEVGELGQAFNAMANDLQAAEGQRRQMTADTAHELRNPLSVIRGNLEAMLALLPFACSPQRPRATSDARSHARHRWKRRSLAEDHNVSPLATARCALLVPGRRTTLRLATVGARRYAPASRGVSAVLPGKPCIQPVHTQTRLDFPRPMDVQYTYDTSFK